MTTMQFIVLCILLFIAMIVYLMKDPIVQMMKFQNNIEDTDFTTLLAILHSIINLELELYDSDVFSNAYSINNSQFENFYKDLCSNIRNNISDDYMREMTKYIKEDAVIKIISRNVKKYLTDKIGNDK